MRVRNLGRGGLLVAALSVLALLPGAGQAAAASAAPAAAPAPCTVVADANLADSYWIAHGPGQAAGNWQNATFNVANLHLVMLTGVANHYSLPWAQKLHWGLGGTRNPFFPDNFAVGEAYIDISKVHT